MGEANARRVFSLTSTGPGIWSLTCAIDCEIFHKRGEKARLFRAMRSALSPVGTGALRRPRRRAKRQATAGIRLVRQDAGGTSQRDVRYRARGSTKDAPAHKLASWRS